jgi:hypothetical protein
MPNSDWNEGPPRSLGAIEDDRTGTGTDAEKGHAYAKLRHMSVQTDEQAAALWRSLWPEEQDRIGDSWKERKRARAYLAAKGIPYPQLPDGMTGDDHHGAAVALWRALPDTERALFEERSRDPEARPFGSFLRPQLARMEDRFQGRERPVPLPWLRVAKALGGGLWPGMHMLVGGTGTGKSQLALQASLHAAKAGTPVLYIGLELGELDFAARVVGLARGIQWSRLFLGEREGWTNGTEQSHVASIQEDDLQALDGLPLWFEVGTANGWPYHRLAAAVAAMKAAHPEAKGPPLVVLDFLQLVAGDPDTPGDDVLRERIGRAAYAARVVARDQGAAVWLISSTARANYGGLRMDLPWRENPTAYVGMGKESGETEYAADSVSVLVREAFDPDNPSDFVWMATAKVRAGQTGWTPLRFVHGSRFASVDEDDERKHCNELEARATDGNGKTEKVFADAGLQLLQAMAREHSNPEDFARALWTQLRADAAKTRAAPIDEDEDFG